jgi:DNA-binding SARP family transcriptional activator/predicted ATPase
MTELQLRVLGELEVIRDGTVLALPPSKKTRALLAYLALSQRPMRREHLCELLWEIPDDPRGSLRWSLSKIRKLVDDQHLPRIIADRNQVAFDPSDVAIDLQELHWLVENAGDDTPLEALEQAAQNYQGGFLEGLELPNFHSFYTWCIGHREQACRSQAALLRALVARLEATPEQALEYANRLVSLLPEDESARARLITLLLHLDRRPEAEQHYRVGLDKLREIGGQDSGALYRAWKGESNPISPAAAAPTTAATITPPARTAGAAGADPQQMLVGRDRELALLAALLQQLFSGHGAQVVLLRGDPGMGKTSLLRACAAMARELGAGILKASAFESEQIRPFAVWNDALRRAMPDNPTSALLGSGERVTRDQVFASLSDLLNEEVAKRPLVVLFDDVQWCEESSASALHYVLSMNRRQPLLVVAAGRDNELRDNLGIQPAIRNLRHDNFLQEIQLGPLAADALRELIGNRAPGVDADRLSRECGGNPLIAQELARAEAQGGTGSSLDELIQDRMSRLDEDARELLLWAAVLSPRIDLNSLAQVTGLEREQIDSAVTAAEQQAILHPGERGFRFSHDLIAKSIYQQIAPARLQVMHRRVAELLEAGATLDLDLAADLAHHAPRSGDPALACRAMISAGRLSLRFYANDKALELYQRGIAFAAQLKAAERVCMTLELEDIRLLAAPLEDWKASVEEYIQLAEQALDHGALTHARLGYQMASYVRWLNGQWTDAQRDSLQAERVTRGATDEAHILGMAEAAKCLALLERDLSQADAMVMEASSLAQRHDFQCPAVPVAQGILRYYEDRFDDAVEHLEDARTLCKVGGDRINEYLSNEYLTIIEIERDDFGAALGHCRALVDISSRLREGSEHPFALCLQALCEYGLDQDDSGLDTALQALREADAKQRLTFGLNRAAMLDIRRGQLALALARAQEALELAQLMERPTEILQAHISLAEIYQQNNQTQRDRHLEAIAEHASGTAARWAQARAQSLLIHRR